MDDWAPGVIVKEWYREPGWPETDIVPYQVKLDCGMTIFAPMDEDKCIRRATGILAHGKIPVTVLTGFLGAGKTTLLNYILTAQHGKRYAVIENEFGDVAIDDMLLDQSVGKQSTMESIAVLDNGCLCCTMREDLVLAIRDIVSKVQERLALGVPGAMIDGILIETTGIADPGPICKTFGMDPIVNKYCKIDGILTVVDAVHFLEQLRRDRPEGAVNEPAQQVAFADKVLLNKVDAVGRPRLTQTIAAIRGVNAVAPIVECSLSKNPAAVPIGELLALDAFDAAKLLTEDGERRGLDIAPVEARADHHEHSHGHEHSHEHGHGHEEHAHAHAHAHDSACSDPTCDDPSHQHAESRHDTDIGTVSLEMNGTPLDIVKFQDFMGDLLSEHSVDMYRYKGVLAVEQKGLVVRYVLQGVHDMTEVSFSGEWPRGTPVKTQVVMIGHKLQKDLLRERFAACAYEPVQVEVV